MSDLIYTPPGGDAPPAMTSREIAELVEARHDSVRRTIERLSEKGVIQLPPLVEVKNHLGQTVSEYVFSGDQGKRDTYVVVAQLCPEFTARLVDRWQELEAKNRVDPASLSRMQLIQIALAAETELGEEREKRILLEHKVEEAAPKAEFYDQFAAADGLYGIQNTARIIGENPNKFSRKLKDEGYLFYQGGALVPYQKWRDKGFFEVKATIVDDKARYRTWVTPKGVEHFANQRSAH